MVSITTSYARTAEPLPAQAAAGEHGVCLADLAAGPGGPCDATLKAASLTLSLV
ncbi:hypothetical protein ACFYRC_36720 [Streptomyces sp. NPDC005279]|uniref:hypothetical protein n=1 Tax=Streptomyces sp. NPDC005279 TaxID=3364712 RepID=UPI0036B7F4B9